MQGGLVKVSGTAVYRMTPTGAVRVLHVFQRNSQSGGGLPETLAQGNDG